MTAPGLARPAPRILVLLVVALLALALVAVLAADAAAGGNLVLRDAGAIARHGAPVAALIADLASALGLGGAVVAGWLLRDGEDRIRALTAAAIAAGVATLGRAAALVLSYAVATGQPVGSPRFGSDLGVYLGTELGIWLVTALVLTAAATTLALTGTSRGVARMLAAGLLLATFATAMTGHAAGDANHEAATSTMLAHLLAVGLWLGGLGALQLLPARSRDDAAVVRGYSHLALISWIMLALSGVWALAVRMNGPGDLLTSAYVQLGALKMLLLLLLGGLGWLQRRALATGFDAGEEGRAAVASYRRLALLELALMGLAVALAAAMSSSPPPADAGVPPEGTAGLLTGYPLPPAPTLFGVLTAWRPDPFGMMVACALLLWWWWPGSAARPRAATRRLLVGAALLVLLTSGPLNVYGKVLVSAHVLQHVLLLGTGVLLGTVPALTGPPGALRRTLGRRPLLGALAAAAPVALLAAAYASPFLRLALDGHAAHLVLQLLAACGGVLLALCVRATAPGRARLLVAAAPVLLLLAAGVTLLLTDHLMAASWFGATGRTWFADALADQRRAGIGVLLTTGLGAVAAVLLARRNPRRAD
ncbi:CopD family protein [Brachybacterium sp. J153]|uniref:CopD family protein n=1 Tax=Brachybacterium sp. J153 TaxID=3116488 RepID=UPI002E79E4EB|nr:CopD family protein [Brachybacterium sp. J153]MEE1618052.1 CopD family protein [Brachybacterium sp. J153]